MNTSIVRHACRFLVSITSVVLIAGCGLDAAGGWTGHWDDDDTTRPAVSSTVPAKAADGVTINTAISATFTEPMSPASINSSTFTLLQGATPVLGTVAYSGVTAVFTPSGDLASNTVYTATITSGARDPSGNSLASDYVWSFTTGDASDETAPTVVFTSPDDGMTAVPHNQKVNVAFSEAMNPSTVTSATFILKRGAATISGTVAFSGVTAVFTPGSNLAPSTTYTATITNGVEDLAGNAMVNDYVWTFTTGVAPDITPPAVTVTVPVNGAIDVCVKRLMTATFSEPMDPLTITTATFTLKQGTTDVLGTVTYSGLTAVFTPSSTLATSTVYTATITTGAKDLAGNPLASDHVWSFTTIAAPDTTKPIVRHTVPANAAVDVAVDAAIVATFSEPVDPLTVVATTFTLNQGATAVSGSVAYSGVTAIFTPDSDLAVSTTYTATIKTGVKDLAGNALAANYVWSFTTGTDPDITKPAISFTSPANDALDVCVNRTVAATFSEPMDPSTITSANFGVSGVTGTVAYDALTNIATFTPTADLAADTEYTATITTGVEDLAGNGLVSNYVWSFTTGTTTCTTAPDLGAASLFGVCGGSEGVTNQGLLTLINGNLATAGASTQVTGLRDSTGDIYTVTPLNDGAVNGRIYTDAPPPGGAGVGGTAETYAIATQALSDANTAYVNLSPAALPGGIDPGAGQLGGLVLGPGIYKAAGGSFLITGSDLTLDAGGDANGVFVFQMASSLSVGEPGAPRSIILINGAQAKNVFWQVGSSATINEAGGGTMVGTIISYAATTFSTAGNVTVVTLEGRALALNASVTMVNTVINVPAP